MSQGPRNAAEHQEAIRSLVGTAIWNGISPQVVATLLAAEAETARCG
ncbi:hypothetical protein LAZ40_06715 [Cereibacter sphaeroides]|nr:hypothetical protein [Cereibacter sphaeroides]MCE6958738.1 hypothetical protein [Cereibacter sphaeroides]MCE6973388.1 hypothetical protein [Cereibacter sphaeroides]